MKSRKLAASEELARIKVITTNLLEGSKQIILQSGLDHLIPAMFVEESEKHFQTFSLPISCVDDKIMVDKMARELSKKFPVIFIAEAYVAKIPKDDTKAINKASVEGLKNILGRQDCINASIFLHGHLVSVGTIIITTVSDKPRGKNITFSQLEWNDGAINTREVEDATKQ